MREPMYNKNDIMRHLACYAEAPSRTKMKKMRVSELMEVWNDLKYNVSGKYGRNLDKIRAMKRCNLGGAHLCGDQTCDAHVSWIKRRR